MPKPQLPSFVRFEGDAIHIDAPEYARLRGITLEEALEELRVMLPKLLADATQIRFA